MGKASTGSAAARASVSDVLTSTSGGYWGTLLLGSVISGACAFGLCYALTPGSVQAASMLASPGLPNLLIMCCVAVGLERIGGGPKGDAWTRPVSDEAYTEMPWALLPSLRQTSRFARMSCMFLELVVPYTLVLLGACAIASTGTLSDDVSRLGVAAVVGCINVVLHCVTTLLCHLALVKHANLRDWRFGVPAPGRPAAVARWHAMPPQLRDAMPASLDGDAMLPQARECVTPMGMVAWVSLVLGPLLFLAGLVMPAVGPALYKHEVREQVKLKDEKSQLWQGFSDPGGSAVTYMEMWLYDFQNPDGFLVRGEKPLLRKVGPFFYRQTNYKVGIKPVDDNKLLNFTYLTQYTFIPEKTPGGWGALEQTVTIPNFFLQGVAAQLGGLLPAFADGMLQKIMTAHNEELFVTKKAKYALMGWDHDVVTKVINPLLVEAKKVAGLDVDPMDSFASLQTHGVSQGMPPNKGTPGDNLMYTGVDDPEKVTVLKRWNGFDALPYWADGDITHPANWDFGTDGIVVGPFHDKSKPVKIFQDTMGRMTPYVYDRKTSLDGLDCDRYVYDPAQLEPTEENRRVWYTPEKGGVWNLTSAVGASVFVSKQHYLDADPWYRQTIDARDEYGAPIVPQRERDDSYRTIFADVGVVLDASVKMQINLELDPVALASLLPDGRRNFTRVVAPIMITITGALAPRAQIESMKSAHGLKSTITNLYAPLIVLGIGMFAFGMTTKQRLDRFHWAESQLREPSAGLLVAEHEDLEP